METEHKITEALLQRYFDEHEARENLVHQDILARLDAAERTLQRAADEIGTVRADVSEQQELFSGLAHFCRGLEAASDLGRLARGILGWIFFLLGTGSLVWIAWQTQHSK